MNMHKQYLGAQQAKRIGLSIGNRQGFTIVELLIVIVIIGILAAISVVAYGGVKDKALVSTAKSELAAISKRANMYQVDNGTYPITSAAWAQVFRDAGLYDKLETGTKDFTICANASTYAITAQQPLPVSETNGRLLHVARPSGVVTATWDTSTATGIYYVTRTCSQPGVISPASTFTTWAGQL